jgi:hypothetical protein
MTRKKTPKPKAKIRRSKPGMDDLDDEMNAWMTGPPPKEAPEDAK